MKRQHTPQTRRKCYDLHESGLGWTEVGKKLGIPAEGARWAARCHRAVKKHKTASPADVVGREQALDIVLNGSGLNKSEFAALLSSSRGKPRVPLHVKHRNLGPTRSAKMLVISDCHIGEKHFHEPLFDLSVKASEDCDFILDSGDHLEGMSGRPGHVYELSHIGYQQQINYCRELYSRFGGKQIYGIDGNHDQWFKQKGDIGVVVGEELSKTVKGYNHLGEWEGDLHIDGLWIRLFHANDGTAYANSYKGQQLINSLSGGEKPHIIFEGHYHKSLYQFSRNIHQFEAGTLCGQTIFMRGKKIAAHMGFWVVTAYWNKAGVTRLAMEWTPFYE